MRARFSTLAVLVMVLSAIPTISAVADDPRSRLVSGTVFLGDDVLPGVEVFVADGAGGRYTCTNEDGYFEFPNTDLDEFFFLATGPAVSEDCSNPKFLDGDGNPLLVATAGGGPAGTMNDFYVERLPEDHPGFFHQLKTALYNCYDHTGGASADILADFDARLDAAWVEGQPKLSEDVVETYRSYAGTLGFIMLDVCPQQQS